MTDDDRRSAGDPGSDDPLTRDLTELSNDLPDLRAVRSTVHARLKTRQRRRRGAALTLAAASVVAVTVGGVALNAKQTAQAPSPAVAASSTAPFTAAAASPQGSTPAAVPPQGSTPASLAVQPPSSSPRAVYPAENVLLLLTDTRPDNSPAGAGNATAGARGNSDTTMVIHFSADRQHVSVLSIPRNTLIPEPACTSSNPTTGEVSGTASSTPSGHQFLFNSAYAVGGFRCTTAAVQELTGLKIDRIVGIDYTGFQTVVDAIGGITVNACGPVLDRTLGTILPAAGTQKVTGAVALSLFRAREVVGENGSELVQIRRQQQLFSALIGQIDTIGASLSPAKLDALLDVFARNTLTFNMSLESLVNLARSIGTLTPAQLSFYTLPVEPSTSDPKMLKVMQPQANQLTQSINDDQTTTAASPATSNRSGQSTSRLTTGQNDAGVATCIGSVK